MVEDFDQADDAPGSDGARCAGPAASARDGAATHRDRLAGPSCTGSGAVAGVVPLPAAEPLPPAAQRQLWDLLWGEGGGPPPGVAEALPGGWQQGLFFDEHPPPGLEWGLVQASGGPCGLLAAVQGELLGRLLFERQRGSGACSGGSGDDNGADGPSSSGSSGVRRGELDEALVEALATMLWRAACGGGDGSRGSSSSGGGAQPSAVLAVCVDERGRPLPSSQVGAPRFPRSLAALRARSRAELCHTLRAAVLPQWREPGGWGVTLLLASLALSRGVTRAAADTDEAGAVPLVGAHGHCSMELVTLALTGRAASNAFDGDRRFGDDGGAGSGGDGGSADAVVLHGVRERSRVGLLSLHEW